MSSRNREAGHKYELDTVKKYREAGFEHVVSTRSESRSRDNQKVDLINKDEFKNGRLPYNVQTKTIVGQAPYVKVLSEVTKEPGIINVFHHRSTKKSEGGKFISKGHYCILAEEDFMRMVKAIKHWKGMVDHFYKDDTQ